MARKLLLNEQDVAELGGVAESVRVKVPLARDRDAQPTPRAHPSRRLYLSTYRAETMASAYTGRPR